MDYTQQSNELIQKLKTADMSQAETLLLILIMNIPMPVEWRMNVFMFLTNPHIPFISNIQIPHLSDFQFGLLALFLR